MGGINLGVNRETIMSCGLRLIIRKLIMVLGWRVLDFRKLRNICDK